MLEKKVSILVWKMVKMLKELGLCKKISSWRDNMSGTVAKKQFRWSYPKGHKNGANGWKVKSLAGLRGDVPCT